MVTEPMGRRAEGNVSSFGFLGLEGRRFHSFMDEGKIDMWMMTAGHRSMLSNCHVLIGLLRIVLVRSPEQHMSPGYQPEDGGLVSHTLDNHIARSRARL